MCEMEDPLELRMTTVGRPMPGVEMGIRQPEGKDFLPAGEPGEVCFKGWCITKGYFDDPQKLPRHSMTKAGFAPATWVSSAAMAT